MTSVSSTLEIPEVHAMPRHVAIIMDGNGRWAKKRFLPRVAGHKKGVDALRTMVQACKARNIEYLTVFAFSSENWRRPADEVSFLMNLFYSVLETEIERLRENGVRLKLIGDLSRFEPRLVEMIKRGEERTSANTSLTLTVAANYGGRWDIMQAVNALSREHPEKAGQYSEQDLAPYLAMAYAPEPDLFIRSGGEQRISNFLLWQLAYTEFYFTDTMWPEFNAGKLDAAIESYCHRERRFGRTSEQLGMDGKPSVKARSPKMLKQRVITALVLLFIFLLVLFWLPPSTAVLAFAVIAALAAWEWARMMSANPAGFAAHQLVFPLWVVFCCGVCWCYPEAQLPACMVASVFWLLVPLWLTKRWPARRGVTAWLVGSILIVPMWIAMARLYAQGPWVLFAAMALVWVADIVAYFVGRAFGRHKLAQAISPGKTWEGAAGAVAGGLIYVFVLRYLNPFVMAIPVVALALATVLLVAISIVGDLFESMMKRQTGLKDSSQLLPGHGGVLDRIDSLTSTLPVLIAVGGLWPA